MDANGRKYRPINRTALRFIIRVLGTAQAMLLESDTPELRSIYRDLQDVINRLNDFLDAQPVEGD